MRARKEKIPATSKLRRLIFGLLFGCWILGLGVSSIADATDADFTFVILPDLQGYSYYPEVWQSVCQWIVTNEASRNIQAVLTVGDLTDEPNDAYFTAIASGFAAIDAAGIPTIPILGNHDYDNMDHVSRQTTLFNKYFGPSYFTGKPWYGGNRDGTDDNYFVRFTVGSRQFLILGLELFPRPDVIPWALSIVDANPDSEVILTTHGYLYYDGSWLTDNTEHSVLDAGLPAADYSGEDMWHGLVKLRKNFRAVFCGHVSTSSIYTAHKIDTGVCGNQVNQVFNDFQNAANGGDGWIGLVTFHPSAGTAEVSYYRTWRPSGLGESTNYPSFTVSWLPVVHLTVNNGTGSGNYAPGDTVSISANTPASGYLFDRWTGATVAAPTHPNTSLIMPWVSTTVTATCKIYYPPRPATSYADWVSQWQAITPTFSGANALENANPDGDQMANFLKYAFNRNPLVNEPTFAPTNGRITIGPDIYYTTSFPRIKGVTDINYIIEAKTNLMSPWLTSYLTLVKSVDDGDYYFDTYRTSLPMNQIPVFFARVSVMSVTKRW